MTALALAAVRCTRWQASVALAANLLFAVVLAGKGLERWLNDTTTKTNASVFCACAHESAEYIPKHQVKGRLLLDVVVTQSATVFKLLTSEDQTLLVRRNALLVLNLGLHIVNRVRGLNLERDRLASQGLDEDLHGRQRRSYDAKETSSSAISRLPPYESLQFCECHVQVYAHGMSSTWHSRAEIFLRRWRASSAHRAAGLVSSDTLQTSKCSIHQATLFGHESTIRRKRQ